MAEKLAAPGACSTEPSSVFRALFLSKRIPGTIHRPSVLARLRRAGDDSFVMTYAHRRVRMSRT
jgi:hypothetical protein